MDGFLLCIFKRPTIMCLATTTEKKKKKKKKEAQSNKMTFNKALMGCSLCNEPVLRDGTWYMVV